MTRQRAGGRLGRRWAAWWPHSGSNTDTNTLAPPSTSTTSTFINSSGNGSTILTSTTTTSTNVTNNSKQAPAIQLERGTKNLILVRPLDKEAPESDQTLLINVKCQPKSSSELGGSAMGEQTIIPVRLIITDANDNAPEFQLNQQIYVLNISEATPIGSLITRDIQAIDRDSAGPHSTVHYRVEEDGSQHAHLLHFPNPLEPALRLAAQLDYESLPSFTLTILAQDQGEPEPLIARAQVQINVIGKFFFHMITISFILCPRIWFGHSLKNHDCFSLLDSLMCI